MYFLKYELAELVKPAILKDSQDGAVLIWGDYLCWYLDNTFRLEFIL